MSIDTGTLSFPERSFFVVILKEKQDGGLKAL
jgi:hypothetical protein